MTPEERAAALEQIAAEVRVCTACRLHRGRTNAVPGEGHPDTEVVFVGEGPGQNEDQQGRPFVGAAGGLLTELLHLVGWRRDQVFITNVVKCRPPGNRDPEPDEIAACAGFLRRQLAVLDPAVIVTLGRYSLGTFMPGAKISGAHGTTRAVDPATGASSATAFAMYHPAAAFRQTALKETLVADMANLPQVLLDARAAREARTGETRPGDGEWAREPAEERTSSDVEASDEGSVPEAGTAPAIPDTPAALPAPREPSASATAREPIPELPRPDEPAHVATTAGEASPGDHEDGSAPGRLASDGPAGESGPRDPAGEPAAAPIANPDAAEPPAPVVTGEAARPDLAEPADFGIAPDDLASDALDPSQLAPVGAATEDKDGSDQMTLF